MQLGPINEEAELNDKVTLGAEETLEDVTEFTKISTSMFRPNHHLEANLGCPRDLVHRRQRRV